jgi:hypothetical protein
MLTESLRYRTVATNYWHITSVADQDVHGSVSPFGKPYPDQQQSQNSDPDPHQSQNSVSVYYVGSQWSYGGMRTLTMEK